MNEKNQPILTPILLDDTMPSYKAVERLRQNLDVEGVHNIGLTGPYGSGKSSVIKTLIKEDNKKHHFLELSLATLNDNEAERDEKKIEANLLKQMIYREKQETLPNSRFRRVQYIAPTKLWIKAVWVIVCVIAFAIAFEPSFLIVDTLYDFFNWGNWNIWFDALALLILLATLLFLAAYLVRTYGRSKLSKLNIADGEIELKEEDSVLSEHLAEILYFFQETEYDVVVFEDLDRFENKRIFLKLREMNRILNQSKELDGRKIRFIYAVKDDMFNDASRTKFFDYIVTIIPVMNMSNARNLLKKELKDRGFDETEISDDDMRVIALFIDDMRMLINIANEYEQYRERLISKNQKLESRKLLAAIVYKNYEPQDFAELHNQKGKMYECISKKGAFAGYAITKVLAERERMLNVKERTMHLSQKELRMVYVLAIVQAANHGNSMSLNQFTIDSRNYKPHEVWESETLFNKLISLPKFSYTVHSYGNAPTFNLNFQEIEKSVSDISYGERLKSLNSDIVNIEKERAKIEKEKSRIRNYPLHELIVKFNLMDEKVFQEIGLSKMAELYLSRGLIAEDYYNYISYFYEGMITQSDRELLLDMNRNVVSDYRRKIDKVRNFVQELPSYVYNTDAILNMDLVDFIAKNPVLNRKELDLIVDRFRVSDARLDFLAIHYMEGTQAYNLCQAYMRDFGKDAWQDISTSYKINEEQRLNLYEMWFRFCSIGDITENQIDWLNSHYEFVSSRDTKIGHLDTLVMRCKFEKLDNLNGELLLKVVNQSAYILTAHNLCVIYRYFKQSYEIKPNEITYGKLLEIGVDGFQSYMSDNINEVINVCTNEMKDEREETIEELLNNENIEDEVLEKYLKGQVNFISNLAEVDDNRLGLAIDCDVVKMIWPNVLHYYNQKKLDERLTKFIVRYAKGLSENKCEGDGASSLFDAIVTKKEIPLEEFKKLIKSFNYYVGLDDSVDWENYDRDKFTALIDEGAVEYTEEDRNVLRRTNAYVYYLTHYKKEFMQELDKVVLGTEDVKGIFAGTDYTLDEKLQIVDAIEEDVIDGALADMICSLLRQMRVDVESSKLKRISQLAISEENKVFAATLYIGKNLGYKDRIETLLSVMPSPYDLILTGAHPKFIKTADNESLLKILETSGYISTKPVEKDGKEYLRTFMKEKI